MKKEYFKSGRINQKLETRNKILNSAQYFLNRGLEFTLEDIAKECGISRATVYRYYSNIEILVNKAALNIQAENPDKIVENIKEDSLEDRILYIQN